MRERLKAVGTPRVAALALFAIFLALYLALGARLFVASSALDLFYGDGPRVVHDMTSLSGPHFRLRPHPLFIGLTAPLGSFLAGFIGVPWMAAVMLTAAAAASCVGLLFALLVFSPINT